MVTVIKRSYDGLELDQDRRFLESLGYAVLVDEDPLKPTNGLLVKDPALRLVALVAEQGEIIKRAFDQGEDPGPCPPEFMVNLGEEKLSEGEAFLKRLWAVIHDLFRRQNQ